MQRKPRILVVGSFVMDLIVSSQRFPQSGETVLGCEYQTAPGGKGANQAVQAAKLGASVTIMGKVGNDVFGHALLQSAQAAGVDVSHVVVHPTISSAIGNVQLEVHPNQTLNRIIVVPGANMAIQAEDVAFLKEGIAAYDLVILQLEIPMEINQIIASYAKQKNVPVMLNSAPSALLPSDLLQKLDYISPNEHEAEDITGIAVKTEEDVVCALNKLRSLGVKNALITLGSRGAAYADQNGNVLMGDAVPNINAKDPTAAGDSFVGAFSTALCLQIPMKQVLCFANHAAALTVCRIGAQPSLPTAAEVITFMRERGQETTPFEVLLKV